MTLGSEGLGAESQSQGREQLVKYWSFASEELINNSTLICSLP